MEAAIYQHVHRAVHSLAHLHFSPPPVTVQRDGKIAIIARDVTAWLNYGISNDARERLRAAGALHDAGIQKEPYPAARYHTPHFESGTNDEYWFKALERARLPFYTLALLNNIVRESDGLVRILEHANDTALLSSAQCTSADAFREALREREHELMRQDHRFVDGGQVDTLDFTIITPYMRVTAPRSVVFHDLNEKESLQRLEQSWTVHTALAFKARPLTYPGSAKDAHGMRLITNSNIYELGKDTNMTVKEHYAIAAQQAQIIHGSLLHLPIADLNQRHAKA